MPLIPGGGRKRFRAAVAPPLVSPPVNTSIPILSISTSGFSGNVGTWIGAVSYAWELRDADDDSVADSGTGTTISGSGTFFGQYYLRVTATNADGSVSADSSDRTATSGGSNDFYAGLLLRSDLLTAMDLRSQTNIDDNTVNGPNTEIIFTASPILGAQVNTIGSIAGISQVYRNFGSRIRSGHLVCVHDYYIYSGPNSYDTHAGINDNHKFNMIGLEEGRQSVAITNSGTTAIVTDSNHGMYTGDAVVISGCTQAAYNGTFAVTIVDADTYTYAMASDPGGAATGTPRKGVNDRRRLEQRYNNYDSTHWVVDTRPYSIGASEVGSGSGNNRITPWVTNTIPLNQWHRVVSEVNMTADPPTYSLRIVLENGTVVVVYDEVPCATLVSNGGLDRWTPLWVNTSLSGEPVTITNSGTTAIVTHVGHELEAGDSIQLFTSRQAVEAAYNGPQVVASVIDQNTYSYIMASDPGGPATPASAGVLAMLTRRIHGYARNCAVLWSASEIDNADLLEAPIP